MKQAIHPDLSRASRAQRGLFVRDAGRLAAWLIGYAAVALTLGLMYLGLTPIEILSFLAITTMGGLALLLAILTLNRRAAERALRDQDRWIHQSVETGLQDRLFDEARTRSLTAPAQATLVLSPVSQLTWALQQNMAALDRNAMGVAHPHLAIDWLVENPEFFDLLVLDVDGLGMPQTMEFLHDLEIADPELPVLALARNPRGLEMMPLRGFTQLSLGSSEDLSKRALAALIAKSASRSPRGPVRASGGRPGWQPRVIAGGADSTGRHPVRDDAANH